MNRKPYGEKCSCGHFESEHDAERKTPTIDNMTQNYRYLIPPAYAIEEIFRTNYKVCHCKNFNPKKKGWEF